MSFTFNDGTPIYFSNTEIRGDVEYIPADTTETFISESGVATSLARKQAEYFTFKLRYETPNSRLKVNSIFKEIKTAYKCSFSFPNFLSISTTFPPIDSLINVDSIFKTTASFTSCIVEFPSDFAYDKIGRGVGAERIQDIEIKVYKSAAFDIPLEPCAAMNAKTTEQLFTLHPWFLNGSSELDYVLVEPKSSEITVTNWPNGILYLDNILTGFKSLMTPVGMIGNAQKYTPDTTTLISGSTFYFGINFIPVTISTGESCQVTTFLQEYGTPLGDFNNDFSDDFN